MKRNLCGLLALIMMLLFAAVTAEKAENGFPELNADGFLHSGEFVFEDAEEGHWYYVSQTLRVEVKRVIQEKPARTWYEAEIICAPGSETPHMIPNNAEKWMKSTAYPYKIARKNKTVIAVSSDYAHLRISQKSRVGIVIRDGSVYSERTWKKGASKFPNLDTLAIWPDGDMKVYDSDELTPEEYLAAGAMDVLAFGPWLIRDGELNEAALAKYGKSKAQRVAVGMAEKGHYWFMMLEGRITRSKGDGISFLAQKLLDKGCVQAFNLDGGQTASILFMGHQLCKMDNKKHNKSSRVTADILGVGVSDLVPAEEDPW